MPYIEHMDGTQLKTWRKAQQLSQAELGKRLGVARETIIRWEAGAPIFHETLVDLACKQLEHQCQD